MVDPVLKALAEEPIGSKALQARLPSNGQGHVPPEAKEAARRASKIWLPEGKRSTNSVETRQAKEEFFARQVDLEDAVEAAGGRRGGC